MQWKQAALIEDRFSYKSIISAPLDPFCVNTTLYDLFLLKGGMDKCQFVIVCHPELSIMISNKFRKV